MSIRKLIQKFSKEVDAILYKFVGNGSAYVDLGNVLYLGNEHIIEFDIIMPSTLEILLGRTDTAVDTIILNSASSIRYRCSDNINNFL